MLLAFLHFYQEIFPLFIGAVNIKNSAAIILLRAQMLRIKIGDVFDFLTSLQKGIEETDKQILIDFCPEKFLEREIRIKIDVSIENTF